MVVDVQAEEAKQHVLQLMKEKDKIEEELATLKATLETNHVGMDDTLIDSQGYPRQDIDVYQVRHARHKIVCLQNDHKALMKKIEVGLHKVHSLASGGEKKVEEVPSTSSTSTIEQVVVDEELVLSEPFLRVNLVSPGSPAEAAGIKGEDLIVEFGSITGKNFKSLKDVGALVENSRNKDVMLKVKRGANTLVLTLTPHSWPGRGLLGCNVVPIENVER